jgi:hypothetical protein
VTEQHTQIKEMQTTEDSTTGTWDVTAIYVINSTRNIAEIRFWLCVMPTEFTDFTDCFNHTYSNLTQHYVSSTTGSAPKRSSVLNFNTYNRKSPKTMNSVLIG